MFYIVLCNKVGVQGVAEAADCVVFSGGCSTVRQPMVEEVSSGEGDPYYFEFYRRAGGNKQWQ